MKRPGLTPAMRDGLNDVDAMSLAVRRKLYALGLIRFGTFSGMRVVEVTPRGHAALAAEPITQGEYDFLCRAEAGETNVACAVKRAEFNLRDKNWIDARLRITPAGRTQLHNIRAAMPGPWVPHSHSDATNTDDG